jgi:hypothetical protein
MSIEGKTWEELGVLEDAGRLLFPETIKRRSKSGAIDTIPICLRPLRKDERRSARLYARGWAQKLGVDESKDPQLFEDLDTLSILARAIREAKPPYEQHQPPEWLESHYDSGSLAELWDRLSVYAEMIDPRIDAMDGDSFWKLVLAIGRARNCLPLVAYAPRVQQSFMVSTVEQALLSPMLKSYLERCASSTPEP